MQQYKFEAIGTWWSIETHDALTTRVKQAVAQRIDEFDRAYSRFRSDAWVTQLRTPGTYDVPIDAKPLIDFYHTLYDTTGGAVSPFVGEVLENAGYDADYSLVPTAMPSDVIAWDDAITFDGDTITTHRPIVLDIGAAGKGYAVDCVAAILEANGQIHYVIDASGDIRHRGEQSETIGLENPHDASKVIGTLPLHNASLCASSSNRRKWSDGWHHVIDARTNKPTNNVVATWVIADSTMVADGLATALFFIEPAAIGKKCHQSVRLMADGTVETSDNFVGELFV